MENKNQTKRSATAFMRRLRNLRSTQTSPSLRIPQGVQAFTTVFLGLLTSFGIFTILSNSAYAASYINVSSGAGGTVSLGSIKPSSTSVSVSGSDTLTITTNCSAGYSVYVSAQNGGDTNLTNTNSSVTTDNTISASSTAVGSTATTLNSNTWGITGDSASASASKYVGLPSYADATNTALISNSSANTTGDNKSTVYYGVKVDTTLSPGTYSGDVLYTTLVSDKCSNYTVHFNANGGSGSMSDQTIPVGTATPLTANAFSRSGYAFLGWATSASGKTGTATNGIGTESDVEYKDKASVTDLAAFNGSIALYAIWEQAGYALTLTNGNTTAISSVALTNTSTGAIITSGSSVAEGTGVTATCTPKSGYHCTEFTSSDTTLLPSQTGNTAVGNYTYSFTMPAGAITLTAEGSGNTFTINYDSNGGSGTTSAATATYGTNVTLATDNFTAPSGKIFKAWGTDASGTTTYEARTTVAPATLKPDVTSTQGGSITLYAIWETITDDGNLGAMQNFICNNLVPGRTATLTDSRDNQTYTIYRFRNAGTAAKSYPSAMAGYCIMTQDLALGYVTGGSITKGSNLTLTTSTSAAEGTITARTGTSDWSTTNSDDNLQYINGPSASGNTYSTHSYYSYGAAQKVCPKGWRPPTNTEYTNIRTFMGGNNSTGSSKIRSAPYNFVYGGYFNSGGWNTVGSYGYYWSSTQNSSASGYYLSFGSSNLNTVGNNKNLGRPVRCVAEPYDEGGTMQETKASALSAGKTTVLTDSRDNQTYTVYRWPSSGTAGTDYPTNMKGYAIMTQDLSLGYVTGGSITKGSNLTLTTTDSAAAGTITARTGTSDWSTTNSDNNLQYINGSGGTYDSHSYYSYGAAQKVCPKGWRPPTDTEYSSIATFMGGGNSAGSSKIRESPYNFVYGGYFYSGGWSGVGDFGYYWSSVQYKYDSSYGYSLTFKSSDLYAVSHGKISGLSVRCVAAP